MTEVVELRLTQHVVDRMLAHAGQSSSIEAVGLLGGAYADKRAVAVMAVPLDNVGGARHFVADPWSQYQGLRQLRQRGCDLVGIYHSHPEGAPALSAIDVAFAERWDCPHVVMGTQSPSVDRAPRIAAYLVAEGGRVSEVPITVA